MSDKQVDEIGYKKIVDSLRYLSHTRPAIKFFVRVISRHM